ncbi:hypothetical protein ES703_107755 [subsurface metagenome]
MRATLITELRQNGAILKRQEQPSRSFVEGLFTLLYLAHAQVLAASPYSHKDVRGGLQGLDCESDKAASYRKGNLAIAAPSGSARILCTPGYGSGTTLLYRSDHVLPGEHIGIQAGTGDTAVSSTDFQLANRVHHGQRTPIAVSTIIEQCDAAATGEDAIYSDYWKGQVFIPYRGHKIDKVDLRLFKSGTPGTLTVEIRAVQYGGTPVGPVLASGTKDGTTIVGTSRVTAEWETITLDTPVWLYPGLKYAIVCHGTGTSTFDCIKWNLSDGNPYLKGGETESTDAGATWTTELIDEDFFFREYGTAEDEIEYGGCEIYGLKIADPNGEFSIRRLFTNNCGSSITIKEIGIQAGATIYRASPTYGYAFPLLIARDVLETPVAVADTQDLEVKYIWKITV